MQTFKGIEYPIKKHPHGYFHSTDDISQIKSNIKTIMLTAFGERVHEPHFGNPLSRLKLNEPPELLYDKIKNGIALAIKKWEKRVQVLDIELSTETAEKFDYLKIVITFTDPSTLQTTHSVTVNIPLGENNE
jgi:phage baseplate assembly protein W